jgi:hypothetical protein
VLGAFCCNPVLASQNAELNGEWCHDDGRSIMIQDAELGLADGRRYPGARTAHTLFVVLSSPAGEVVSAVLFASHGPDHLVMQTEAGREIWARCSTPAA